MNIPYVLIWLILLIVFAIIEGVSSGLVSVWFSCGSLIALLCALFGAPVGVQLILFVAVSAVCLLGLRPLAKKYVNSRVQATNADRIIGTDAQVTETIDNVQGTGTVTVSGIIWTAKSENNEVIPEGCMVRILRIEGVKVIVEPSEKEDSSES